MARAAAREAVQLAENTLKEANQTLNTLNGELLKYSQYSSFEVLHFRCFLSLKKPLQENIVSFTLLPEQ